MKGFYRIPGQDWEGHDGKQDVDGNKARDGEHDGDNPRPALPFLR